MIQAAGSLDHGGSFWLSDVEWAAIEPHISKVYTGKRRVDDRRVISGVVHRLREGCRWRALPEAYGPYTTAFNRYNLKKFSALREVVSTPPERSMVECGSEYSDQARCGKHGSC